MNTPAAHFFLAVPVPDHVKEVLHHQSKQLKRKVPYKQWTHPLDYHVTLAFLGAAHKEKLGELKHMLSTVVERCAPFAITLDELGTFGKKQQPRVLWAGVSADRGLYDLQRRVAKACRSVGFPLDERPYKPHITLAKKWTSKETLDLSVLQTGPEPVSWQVQNIVLYETHLRRNPKYEPVNDFPLCVDR